MAAKRGTAPSVAETPDESIGDATAEREVVLDETARDTIDDHVGADTSVERGGVLVGRVDEVTGRVEVHAAVPATKAVGAVASLTFTHEAWDEVNEIIAAAYPDDRMVGWYHSHPGFGVFLSQYDTFIHQNFFSASWQLAYVVDPVLGKAGFFGWEKELIVRQKTWTVIARGSSRAVKEPDRDTGKTSSSESPPSGITFPTVFAAVLVAMLGGILGGYFAHTYTASDIAPTLNGLETVQPTSGMLLVRTSATDNGKVTFLAMVTNRRATPIRGYITNCGPTALLPATKVVTGATPHSSPSSHARSSSAAKISVPPGACAFVKTAIPPHASLSITATGDEEGNMPQGAPKFVPVR
jgi:proteasome lid subunit RPN8/RPN11